MRRRWQRAAHDAPLGAFIVIAAAPSSLSMMLFVLLTLPLPSGEKLAMRRCMALPVHFIGLGGMSACPPLKATKMSGSKKAALVATVLQSGTLLSKRSGVRRLHVKEKKEVIFLGCSEERSSHFEVASKGGSWLASK